ncbi:uncharacterized protein LOC111380532 [Olea europaea var. sylvestris]|uniref:uncharacterized protein LOC111380532 n=1 Tax=Olea europaea var. sylvestris TaxID=158386 RepID=UPI000C1D45C4|nr:uncharacterized protein LOC111380532 [Olea europaea var. sylvestris]
MTVGEYIRKFEQLSRFATHMVNIEVLKIERFLEGLRPELYRDGKRPRIDQGKASTAQPSCPKCGGQHTRACPIETRTCYVCGKVGHLAIACPGNPNPMEQKKVPARVFTRSNAETNPSVVTGKFSIFGTTALVLFDSGATHSFMSIEYVRRLGRTPDRQESVTFQPLGNEPFTFIGFKKGFRVLTISVLKAQRLLDSGCVGYLVSVNAIEAQHNPNLSDVRVAQEFPEVFLDDLLGVPPDHEIEFVIDLIPRTSPISKAPYRRAPTELKELKLQLHELLDKGFIRPSFSL